MGISVAQYPMPDHVKSPLPSRQDLSQRSSLLYITAATTTVISTTIFMLSFLRFPLSNVNAFHLDSRLTPNV
jgi:hypothetical protein